MRSIDADALIKKIADSIRLADEWEKESLEKQDAHGLTCAIETIRSLLCMIERIKEEPDIEAEPVKHGRWRRASKNLMACSACGNCVLDERISGLFFCYCCGAKMDGGADDAEGEIRWRKKKRSSC